jgi:hypothetical protein
MPTPTAETSLITLSGSNGLPHYKSEIKNAFTMCTTKSTWQELTSTFGMRKDIKNDYKKLSHILNQVLSITTSGKNLAQGVKKQLNLRSTYERQGKLVSQPNLHLNIWHETAKQTLTVLRQQKIVLGYIKNDLLYL